MTTLALTRGVVVELYPGAPPALVVPHINYRASIAAFDAAVLCSLITNHGCAAEAPSEISPDVFAVLAGSGAVALDRLDDMPPSRGSSLTLSDWAVLHACQYAPLPIEEAAPLFELTDGARTEQATTALPQPSCLPSISLWEAIRSRRSMRDGPTRDVPLAVVSTMFTYSARTVASARDGQEPIYFRPVASGGARHPVDIYLIAVRVESLAQGIFRYEPQGHSLSAIVTSGDLVTRLVPVLCRAMASDSDCRPAFVLLFDLVVDRTAQKYGAAAAGLILRDLGCVLQQLHLVMTGLDLVGCAIGRLPCDLMERILGLNLNRHVVLGGFAVW